MISLYATQTDLSNTIKVPLDNFDNPKLANKIKVQLSNFDHRYAEWEAKFKESVNSIIANQDAKVDNKSERKL